MRMILRVKDSARLDQNHWEGNDHLSGFNVKSDARHNGPSLKIFNFSADKYREKCFSQTCRLENWLKGANFLKKLDYLVLNDADFGKATNLSGFDVKSNARKNGCCLPNFHSSPNQV